MTSSGRIGPVVGTALAVLLAVSLAGIAWFVFAGDGRELKPPVANARSPDVDPEESQDRSIAVAAARASEWRESDRQSDRREVTFDVPSDQLPVVVVRAKGDGALVVVEKARVGWATEEALVRERESRSIDNDDVVDDDSALVDAIGVRGATDRNGLFCIPRAKGPLALCVRSESLFAFVRAAGDEPWVTVELFDDDSIRVQIVDADAKPQPGLIASFGLRGQELSESSRRARATGASAIATIRGVRAFGRAAGRRAGDEWGVSVVAPSREPLFVPVDLAALPKEPVVVRLPPWGGLRLSFVGRDGLPVLRPVRVRLLAYPRRVPEQPDAAASDLFERRLVVHDGSLELPFVGCGLRFDVNFEVDGGNRSRGRLDGPDAAGERVEHTYEVDFGPLAFSGMVVYQDNLRVGHRRVTIRVLANRGMNGEAFETPCVGEGETDEGGCFSIPIAVGGREFSFDCEVVVHSPNGLDRTLKAVAIGHATAPAVEMGTLYLPRD